MSAQMGQAEQAELLFAFLEDFTPLEELKKMNLEGFDWSSRDETGKTLLVFAIQHALYSPRLDNALKTIDWLIYSGASVQQKCTGGKSVHVFEEKPDKPRIDVECQGLSAISFVRALQRKMRAKLEHWKDQEAFLAKVVKSFAVACFPSPARRRVSIDEGIAELWEKSLAAKESHDLTIVTADGVVTAHAHMLKAASAVVAAMLGSPMKEGKAQRIEIKDTAGKAVSLFLEILYTCSVPDELDHQSALHALDLAHRWQVDVVVAILSDLLAGMITDESFSVIAEHAILKGLERLKAAAQRFGAESKKVQADLKAGRLPAVVVLLFHGGSPSKSNEPKPKRRRV